MTPPRDLACNPGMCPDQESDQQPFGLGWCPTHWATSDRASKALLDILWLQSVPGQSEWLAMFKYWRFSTAMMCLPEAGEGAAPPWLGILACPGGSLSSCDNAFLFCRIHFEKPGGHFCYRAASSQAAAALQPGGFWAGGGSYSEHCGWGLSFTLYFLRKKVD